MNTLSLTEISAAALLSASRDYRPDCGKGSTSYRMLGAISLKKQLGRFVWGVVVGCFG
ncbi:hypothetical protein MNBD_GAMMA11-2430 [hydrothermal vent metagenome]|uniref:Uncharacterized protein n=1 Tax=hydrothermal vent metagenome TaxID=652676 RepID=A0A3B0X918_9ZZZZ